MAVIGQGLVLMIAGMGIVYLFLIVLIIVAKYASAFVARFDGIIPQETPKKAPAPTAAAPAAATADPFFQASMRTMNSGFSHTGVPSVFVNLMNMQVSPYHVRYR